MHLDRSLKLLLSLLLKGIKLLAHQSNTTVGHGQSLQVCNNALGYSGLLEGLHLLATQSDFPTKAKQSILVLCELQAWNQGRDELQTLTCSQGPCDSPSLTVHALGTMTSTWLLP